MNLHEYQAKQLFSEFGVPVPQSIVADTPEQAEAAAGKLGGKLWVVKAQVHAGGRGKGGGVKLARDAGEVASHASAMLGTRLVTPQTDEHGQPVNSVMVEQGQDIARELYLSVLLDRDRERVIMLASPAGGMDIEQVAAETPEQLHTVAIHPATGFQSFHGRRLGFAMGLDKEQTGRFVKLAAALYRFYTQSDASLVEINPLIVTGEGELLALDAKVNLDDNALFRQQRLAEMRDTTQEDEAENRASEHGLNYVTLDGDIGCMVNGAGLAMATMDVIKLHGGRPANFLDVGGGTTAERVTEAFKLILSDQEVKAILVNIFGGIVRCDLIAEGIIAAVKEVDLHIPVVVRLQGTNVDKGREMLEQSGLALIAAEDLGDAADKVVAAAAG